MFICWYLFVVHVAVGASFVAHAVGTSFAGISLLCNTVYGISLCIPLYGTYGRYLFVVHKYIGTGAGRENMIPFWCTVRNGI